MTLPLWCKELTLLAWKNACRPTEFGCLLKRKSIELNLQQHDYDILAAELLRLATLTSQPNLAIFDCLKLLVYSQKITWSTFLNCLATFVNYSKTKCVVLLTHCLHSSVDSIRCNPNDAAECKRLADAIYAVYLWIVSGIQFCYRDIEYQDCVPTLITTALVYIREKFPAFILRAQVTSSAPSSDEKRQALVKPLLEICEEFGEDEQLRILVTEMEKLFMPVVFEDDDDLMELMHHSRSGLRTLAVVFCCFRTLATVTEIAAEIQLMSHTMGVSILTTLHDILHTALLMHVEDSEKAPFVEGFLYIKFPRVFVLIAKEKNWSVEDTQDLIHQVLQEFEQPWNCLDSSLKEHSMIRLIEILDEYGLISHDYAEQVVHFRTDGGRKAFIQRKDDKSKSVLVISALSARPGVDKCLTDPTSSKMISIMSYLVGTGNLVFDAICATYCVEGNISAFSTVLARVNHLAEQPGKLTPEGRAFLFDISFMMLVRIATNFPNEKLYDLIAGYGAEGLEKGCFYHWTKVFVRRIGATDNSYTPRTMSPEEKNRLRDQFRLLKDERIFWDPKTVNFSELVWLTPNIGEILLEDFSSARIVDQDQLIMYKKTFCTLRHATFILMNLVFWLDSQPVTEARTRIARVIREVLDEYQPTDERTKWMFVNIVCRRMLDDMVIGRPIVDPMTYSLLTMATKSLPKLGWTQLPATEMLKKGWIYAQRQNWCDVTVLTMVDRCNRAGQHKLWVEFWLHQLLKLRTCDDMQMASRMIMSTALLDPLRSLLAICQILVDYVLDSGSERGECRYEPPHVLPLSLLLCQVLVLSEWCLEDGRNRVAMSQKVYETGDSGESTKKRRRYGETPIPFPDELETSVIDELQQTVEITVNRMEKEVRKGLLTPIVTFIIHMVRVLAVRCPQSNDAYETPWKNFMKRLPHSMLFNLAVLDPCSVTFELFTKFCEPGNEEHEHEKISLLCLLKSHGAM